GWVMLAAISYSPSRYYVTLYPAMASLAAVALWRIPKWMEGAVNRWTRYCAAAIAGFAVFHLVLAIIHYRGVFPHATSTSLLYGLALAVAIAVVLGWER